MTDHKPVEQLKREAERAEGTVEKNTPHTPTTVTKPVRDYRAYLFMVYVILATVGFGVLFVLARTTPYFQADLLVARVIQSVQIPGFAELMVFLTWLGLAPQGFVWTAAIIVLVFVIGLRWEALVLAFATGGVQVMGQLIKLVVQRARPTPDLVNVFAPMNEYSFPSSHVLHFTVFFGLLMFLIYTLAPHSRLRILGVGICAAFIALIGVSRIYLGQHWPSDVLGAYLFASIWLALAVYVYRWGKPRFFAHQPAASEKGPTNVAVKS